MMSAPRPSSAGSAAGREQQGARDHHERMPACSTWAEAVDRDAERQLHRRKEKKNALDSTPIWRPGSPSRAAISGRSLRSSSQELAHHVGERERRHERDDVRPPRRPACQPYRHEKPASPVGDDRLFFSSHGQPHGRKGEKPEADIGQRMLRPRRLPIGLCARAAENTASDRGRSEGVSTKLATVAGEAILPYFRTSLGVEDKSRGAPSIR